MTDTHCPYCALQCGMTITAGDRPAARPRDFPVNRGGLCQKGWTSADLLSSSERILAPTIASAPCSWEEAIGHVTATIRRIQDRHGKDAVAVYGSGALTNEKAYLLGKFARVALGTSQIDYNGRFCMSSAAAAGNRAFGLDRGLPFPVADLGGADLIVLAGANPAETMPPLMRHLTGARLIVIDPRRTPTAEAARNGGGMHLQPVPGTDLALALGLLHVAWTEGYLDTPGRVAYREARTTGWESARAAAARWRPERTERLTGVPAADLRRAAHLLHTATRAYVLTGRGAEQHSKGTDTATAWINLALAFGLPGTPGSGYGCITGQGNGQGGREHGQKADQLPGYRLITDPAAREHVAGVWGLPPEELPGPGRSAVEMFDALGSEIKALLVFGANPVLSAPRSAGVAEKLRRLDLLVVADFLPSETVRLADVVLPTAMWAEESGTTTNLEGRLLRRRQALDPPPGVRTDLEILSALAAGLGRRPDEFPSDPDAVLDELGRASKGGRSDYSAVTPARIENEAEPFHWGGPRMFLDRFAHDDGRARFVPVDHRDAAELPDDEYPLFGTTGRILQHYQTGAQTRRVAELAAAAPEAFVEVHPDTAARTGLDDGMLAMISSRRGDVTATVRTVPTLRPDTVFLPFCFPGDGSANVMTSPALDPVSRMPEFKVCAVRLEPARVAPGQTARRPAPRRALPADDIVCRCNMVTKSALRDAWYRGARSAQDLSDATRAATGCGTCGDDVAAFASSLSQRGASPRKGTPMKVVVIGHGMVGHRFVEALLSRDEGIAITVLSEESRPAYDRVALSSFFDGAAEEDLRLPGLDAGRVDLRLGVAAVAIDRDRKVVVTDGGDEVGYDELVLATGSYAFVPPVEGRFAEGCFVYRTLDDLDAIKAAAGNAASGVVIGGGLLGLEAANALRLLGLKPYVVEMAPHLMAVQIDEGGGALLADMVTDLGVDVHCGAATTRITVDPETGRATGVELKDGTVLDAGVVIFAAGVRSRDQLAREAGLEIGPRGGVVVDESCRSVDDEHIHAIGEVACVDGSVYGLVAPGYAMAETVADRLLGGDATFPGADLSTKLKLLGIDVASFGDAKGTAEGALEVVVNDPVRQTYGKLVVSDDTRTLLGGILVGDASQYALLRAMVGAPLTEDPSVLLAGTKNRSADQGFGVGALPPSAQICSCNAVTKGDLLAAITSGDATDVPGLKASTRAGTGCGSCVPALKQILTSAGVEQSRAICEHFDVSRAELFEIIAGAGLRTFTEVIEGHGRGRGCDLCRPAVASILASLHTGDHILDGERYGLQDTNDRHLANMQRNGTYSVVPRVPGGEISPAKLKVIAEVAEDFGLYTKITGGQRIDLFGARLEQLPRIWHRLTEAGFESGHAYGKALRTVKSCVGSTWCRYGVQDSVALAIELELRYRGLRSPHKMKGGVSGCARECAEARSKDFGVIATENGWNLYVAGNGGFRPRHADLLVSDVPTDELITIIDRFLMFYIRTADRLQRTAAWIESLEGGLDHLRDVIVRDSLGICADLDEAMSRHISSYKDEWKAVLEDPERLAKFTSFLNAPGVPDPMITFTDERGQKIPAPARPLLPLEVRS